MDDRIPVLAAENYSRFKKLNTIPHFSFHLVVSTIISIVGIVLAATWPEAKKCEAYFIMIYLRCAWWLLTLIFDHLIKHHHNELKLNGYHDFSRMTYKHKSVPLQIVSLWNTVILGVAAGLQHYYGDHFGEKCIVSFFSPVSYITAFTILESLILLFVNGTYIRCVLRFNSHGMPPDAMQGMNSVAGSVGLTQRDSEMRDLLEKQADLIHYLKDHNLKLNQKLMQINNQLRTATIHPHPSI